MKVSYSYIAVLMLLTGVSCGDSRTGQGKGPIVLGDSASIVTESDTQYLRDEVLDIEPKRLAEQAAAPPAKAAPEAPKPPVKEEGATIDLGTVKIVLPGIQLRERKGQNAERESSLSYTLTSGKPENTKLLVYGAGKVTIRQRYQSRLMLKSSLGSVDLRDLGLYTSGWDNLKVTDNNKAQQATLSSLDRLGFARVTNSKIKNAADRELRKRRTNSRTIRNWMKEIQRTRSATDKPCEIILDNVQWQISGTDDKGKDFRKSIRVDL